MRAWIVAGMLMLTFPAASFADVVVSIHGAQISQGGTGSFEVWATADPFSVADFGIRLSISSSSGRLLRFVSAQSEAQITNDKYLFLGIDNHPINGPLWTTQVDILNNTYSFFDTYDIDNHLAPTLGSEPKLLAIVNITAATENAPLEGDQFTISLAPDPISSFHDDATFDPVAFTSNSGTITVTSAPEPATGIAAGVFVVGALLSRRLRRRRAKTT